MTAVNSLFGNFSEDDLKDVRSCLDEINVCMSKINAQKESIKAIIDAVYDKHKLPKKIIRRMAKAHFKQTFDEEVTEDKEFEVLYSGVVEKQQ